MNSSRINCKVETTLVPVNHGKDILPEYRQTPIGDLLAYHNLGAPHRHHTEAELLIGMCMDHRMQLRIPTDFAFVLRCAGANLGLLAFDVSFSIAVGQVRCVCLIGHDGCRMIDVASKREAFISGLVDRADWDRHRAEKHFDEHSSRYGFGDPVSFVWLEAERLRTAYRNVTVAPLVYSLEDRRLRQITHSRPSAEGVPETVKTRGGEERSQRIT